MKWTMIRTSNPVFKETTFSDLPRRARSSLPMTIEEAIHRTLFLLVCVLTAAAWTWSKFIATHDPASVQLYGLISLIGGFPMALVTVFKKKWSAVSAPLFALFEGVFWGQRQ
jgi:uncharacterized YccA/Bax inhibitor family protein